MTDNELIQTIERQLRADRSPTLAQTAALLSDLKALKAARADDQRTIIQAQVDQNTYRALVVAHEALCAGHRQDLLAHQQTAEALQESEARFRAIFEGAELGIALVDLNGRPVESNRALQQFLGYARDDLAGMTFAQFTHPDDVAADRALFCELLAGQRDHYEIEKRYLRQDGAVVWGRLTVSLIRTPQRRPLFAIAMVADITARKQSELALQESNARKLAILEAALDAIITVDHTGKVVEWNPAAERMFGFAQADAVGRMLADLIIPPSRRLRHRQRLARAYVTGEAPWAGQPFEMTGLRADGSEIPIEVAITRIAVDGPPLFTGYVRDITERKRAEAARRFLAESSRVLAMTQDFAATLSQVVRLAVPFLADCCAIDVLTAEHSVRRQAVSHVDPAKEETLRLLQKHSPLDPHRLHQVVRVLQTKRPEIIADITDHLLETLAPDLEQRSILRKLRFRSAMIVPLIAHGRTLGTIFFATSESQRQYQADDLVLAQDLAVHVAYAIENAQL